MPPESHTPCPPPRGRRARWQPLGLSFALHAAVALLLWQGLPATSLLSPPPPPEPLEIELIAEPPQQAPAPSAVAPERSVDRGEAPVKLPRPPRPPPSRTPEPPPPVAEPAAPAPPRRPLPGLTPDFGTIDRLTREGVIAPPDPSLAPPPENKGPSKFAARLAERTRDDAARANVAAGKVQPQLYDFLRDARRGFTPNPAALDADPRAPNTVARSVAQWGKGVREMYRGWRRQLDDERRRLDHDPDRRGAPDILEHYNRMLESTARAVEPMDCLVCLVVRRDGPPEVVLTASSGNAEVDRAAVEALRRSANTRPVDEDVRPQKTCYRFRATVHRVPPIPIAGCAFDEVALTASCYYPTKKLRKVTVNLESVDYDG
jgi:outer membrane biosynthesis protein TonB